MVKLTEKNLELHLTGNGFTTAVGWEVPTNVDYEELMEDAKSLLKLRELLEKRIEELDNQIIKIQNRPDGVGNKSLAIHDAKYEQSILQKQLEESEK